MTQAEQSSVMAVVHPSYADSLDVSESVRPSLSLFILSVFPLAARNFTAFCCCCLLSSAVVYCVLSAAICCVLLAVCMCLLFAV